MIPTVMVEPHHLNLDWPGSELTVMTVHPDLDWKDDREGFAQCEWSAMLSMTSFEHTLTRARETRTQLILLSEYALPSDHFPRCTELAQAMPPNSICMAGLDRMRPERWHQVLCGARNAASLRELGAEGFEWVNAAVIWVREGEASPTYFVQPKLEPYKFENNTSMLRGDRVLHFTAGHWRLAQVICHDFIASRNNRSIMEGLLWGQSGVDSVPHREGEGLLRHLPDTDLLVVLQANDDPFNVRFLQSAQTMVTSDSPRVGAVAFVNVAGQSEYSGFHFRHDLWTGEKAETPINETPAVFRVRRLDNLNIVYAGFRQNGAAIHHLHYSPSLHAPSTPRDPRLLRDPRVASINDDGTIGPLKLRTALDHYLALVYQDASETLGKIEPHPDLEQALTESYTAMGVWFPTGLAPERQHEILQTLLGRVGPAVQWATGNGRCRTTAARLLVALCIFGAGGFPIDLALSDRAQAARHSILHRPITGHADAFTIDIVAGDPDMDRRPLLAAYWTVQERYRWLSITEKPHVCLLLQVADHDDKPILASDDDLSLRGSRTTQAYKKQDPRLIMDDRQKSMALGGTRRVFSYSYNGLRKELAKADSRAVFTDALKGVLPCPVA